MPGAQRPGRKMREYERKTLPVSPAVLRDGAWPLPALAVPVLAAFPDTVELDVDCYCDPGGAANRKGKPFPVDDISISAGELSNSTAANGTKTSTSLLAGIPKGTAATITITLPKRIPRSKMLFFIL